MAVQATVIRIEGDRCVLEVVCRCCGETFEISVQTAAFEQWVKGTLNIQDAMPDVPKELRELLISATCGPCFDLMFPDVEGSAGVEPPVEKVRSMGDPKKG